MLMLSMAFLSVVMLSFEKLYKNDNTRNLNNTLTIKKDTSLQRSGIKSIRIGSKAKN